MAEKTSALEQALEELAIEKVQQQEKTRDRKKVVETESVAKTLLFSRKRAEVSFESNGERGLNVTIDTEHLHLRSVTKKDEDSYAELYGDKEVMEKFATGVPLEKKKVQERVAMWEDRWKDGIPFSSLAVFKQDSEQDASDLLGHVVLGFGEKPKESELGYLFHKKHWGKGIGTESVEAVVLDYAPELPKRGYKLNEAPFEAIVATARVDNQASWKILKHVGMEREQTPEGGDYVSEKFGGKRYHYRKKIG